MGAATALHAAAVRCEAGRGEQAISRDPASPPLTSELWLEEDGTMFRPTKARTIASCFTLIAGAMFLGACSGEVTAPVGASPQATEARSMFVPSASAKALIGVADGTYTVTFDPSRDQSIPLGPNSIDIPANAVCNLLTSGYGAAYWNASCSPQKLPVTLVITIKNASTPHPSLEFYPAMRFNPTKNVQLFMYAPKVNKNDAKNWLMYYCPDKGKCVDESLTDDALATYIDHSEKMLFRRVKHFSGYTVAERALDEIGDALAP